MSVPSKGHDRVNVPVQTGAQHSTLFDGRFVAGGEGVHVGAD